MDTTNTLSAKFGFYASIALTILTIITFGFAMTAIPPSGPYCTTNCMEYPFRDLLNYYPRDYYWMYLAIFQLFTFLIFVISIHFSAPYEKKIFSFTSVAFAIISTTVLLADYFIQFAVIPISMIKGETEGIALLTQYNGHGIFIALEELGYITMSIALFFMAPVFFTNNRLEKVIRWLLFLPLILNVLAFVAYSIQYGIDRSYRFEVASISINWLFMISAGISISIFFKQIIKTKLNSNE
ncbi:MAG: hypothetical protein ACOYMD_06790 [Paludibacter sp.]